MAFLDIYENYNRRKNLSGNAVCLTLVKLEKSFLNKENKILLSQKLPKAKRRK